MQKHKVFMKFYMVEIFISQFKLAWLLSDPIHVIK